MNSALSIFAVPLIALQLFIVETKDKPCKKADLAVVEILQPEYDSEISGTIITVEITNLGKSKSAPCTIRAYDLDISYEEIVAENNDTIVHEMIAENNGRAEYYNRGENKYTEVDENQFDYDFYWEVIEEIPALKPNQKYTVTFKINNHWIYDSNCEIRIIIDEAEEAEDCDRENNQMDFFGWG